MLQIIDLENNQLFTQVASEESAAIIGGAGTDGGMSPLNVLGFSALTAIATGVIGSPAAHALIGFATLTSLFRS